MDIQILRELQALIADINPAEVTSHITNDTLFSWLGQWRGQAEMLIAFLLENEKCKLSEKD